MESIVIIFLMLYFAFLANPQSTTPNSGIDIANIVTQIQDMEQSLSHVRSDVQTQDQKYAAVLSSVLSKLTITTDELSTVKADLKTLKEDYKATKVELETVKAELKSTQEELRLVSDSAERNMSTCVLELERLKDVQNVSEITITSLEADIVSLTNQVNVTESSVVLVKSDVISLRTEMDEVERDLNSSQLVSDTTERKLEALSVKHEDTTNDVRKLQHDIGNCQGHNKGNHVAFQASLNYTGYVSSTLRFNRVDLNTGGSYNATTGMFTAPVNGTYLFWANVLFYTTPGVHTIYLYQGQRSLASGFATLHQEVSYSDAGVSSVFAVVHLYMYERVHFATDSTPSQAAGFGHSHYGGVLLYGD